MHTHNGIVRGRLVNELGGHSVEQTKCKLVTRRYFETAAYGVDQTTFSIQVRDYGQVK